MRTSVLIPLVLAGVLGTAAQPVTLYDHDAVVWSDAQTIRLKATVLDNPNGALLSMRWSQDERNAMPLSTAGENNPECAVQVPTDAKEGEYAFSLLVACSDGDTVRA